MSELSVGIFKSKGRYNLCSNETQWCVNLRSTSGNFSETWDENEEPDIDGLLPSEVINLIEERLKSYWINTGRAETLKRIEKWREKQNEYDLSWIEDEIAKTLKELKRLNSIKEDILETITPNT